MTQLPDSVKGRYLWLPVKSSKLDRHALEVALPAALTFLSDHLQQGRRVLVHCVEGDSTIYWLVLPLSTQAIHLLSQVTIMLVRASSGMMVTISTFDCRH